VHADSLWSNEKTCLLATEVKAVQAGTKDLRIVMAWAAPISGVVRGADGVALAQVAVMALDGSPPKFINVVWTDGDGRFTLPVAAGSEVTLKATIDQEHEILLAGVKAGSTGIVLQAGTR
jgi:hypothetical protein